MIELFVLDPQQDSGLPLLDQARASLNDRDAKAHTEALASGSTDEVCRKCKAVWLAHQIGPAKCAKQQGAECFFAQSPLERKKILAPRPGGQIVVPL